MEDNEKVANKNSEPTAAPTGTASSASSPTTSPSAAPASATGAAGQAPQYESNRRGPLSSTDDVILGELVAVASRSAPKLRELLEGTIMIAINNSDKRYLIDWSQPQIKAEKLKASGSAAISAACTIALSEDNLLKIANGDLNPQIAMLAQKIKVEGRKAAAMYFFNLIAPQQAY